MKITLAGAAVVSLLLATNGAITATVQQTAQDGELTIGQETFNELKARSEIIDSSPLYDVLLPVIQPIMQAAQARYNHPFKVYLVHEAQPNAFATPGGYIYVVDALLYSRQAEARADSTGADVCAAAGSNPWGLVWLFQVFKDARTREIPQLLSDHPNDQNRIEALERHFKSDSGMFGRFDPNLRSATPFEVPKRAPEVFLR